MDSNFSFTPMLKVVIGTGKIELDNRKKNYWKIDPQSQNLIIKQHTHIEPLITDQGAGLVS